MRFSYLIALVAAVILQTPCYSAELIEAVPVCGVGAFYRTSPGSFAFIPNAQTESGAHKAVFFRKFGRSGAYKIRPQDSYWFIVNHKTNGVPEATYLGVEMIAIYPSGVKAQTPVFLRRNANWVRAGDPGFKGNIDKRAFDNKSMDDFFSYHYDESNRGEMDQAFFKWHASPYNSNRDSWGNRLRWQPSEKLRSDKFLKSFFEPIPSDADMTFNGMLLRFETTKANMSKNPVVFGFDGADPIAAYIKVFSPDAPEYDKEYFVTFK